jgi:hypothetical protein
MLTATSRIQQAAIVCALACALFASAIGTAPAAAVLTRATVRGTHATKTPAPAKLTASERAYLRGIAALDYEQLAAAYNPAWRGEL